VWQPNVADEPPLPPHQAIVLLARQTRSNSRSSQLSPLARQKDTARRAL